MNLKSPLCLSVVVLISAFLGALFQSTISHPKISIAQESDIQSVVRARSFYLLDGDNNMRAALTITSKDIVALSLKNRDESSSILISVDQNGSANASFFRQDNTVIIGAEKSGPGLLLGKDKKLRADLGVYDDGPSLMFADDNGHKYWSAP